MLGPPSLDPLLYDDVRRYYRQALQPYLPVPRLAQIESLISWLERNTRQLVGLSSHPRI